MVQPSPPEPELAVDDLPRRPIVKAGLRRVWRDATTLQIGIGERHAVLVQGAGPEVSAFLDRLDGTVEREQVAATAARSGLDGADALDLLRRLRAHGALDDASADSTASRALGTAERDRLAPDVASWTLLDLGCSGATNTHAARRDARVDVHGAGRVGALAAVLLAHAGVGELRVVDDGVLRAADVPAPWARAVPADAGAATTRSAVALDVCEQLAPSLRTNRRRPRRDRPTFALLAPVDALGTVDLDLRDALVRDQVPHLPAYVRETVGVVGPLVVPGATPCLRCLDLHRSDRDRGWPRVLAQIAPTPAASPGRRRAVLDACDGVLAAQVAAQAVLQVLAHLDGRETSARATALDETDLADGLTRRRAWAAHPACGCMWT